MAAEGRGPGNRALIKQGWRNVRAAGPYRLAATAALLVLSLLIARFSWSLPVLGPADSTLYDQRAYISAPAVPQDQRVTIVAYTDQTLIAARKRSPLDRGILARALRNLDTMGAKAIGIDVLFDQPQDEDEELIATLRSMRTPTGVAYAEAATNSDNIRFEQQQYLDGFVARLKGSRARPVSVRLTNADVARDWPLPLPHLPPLMGKAMLADAGSRAQMPFARYDGALRYRLPESDAPVFASIPIDVFADPALESVSELRAALAQQIAGRYVLIGGEIVDIDQFETPFTAVTDETIPGIQIHATMIAQMLDGAKLPALSPLAKWLLAALVVGAAALTSLFEARVWKVVPLLTGELLLIAGLPFGLQQNGFDTLGTPAVGWAAGWALAFFAVSSAARASGSAERQFAQTALGKYLPRDIAQEIIDNPEKLSLSGSKRELFIVFSDLEGFTKLSHALEPEVVARLLNDYLDRLSAVVLKHGGIIDKYVGDAVVAFWGAPIARPDDGRNAALAGYALWQAGEEFRRSVDPALATIGKTRVGMHFGEAVVGNFGGERRIQYTALGDAMNTAARLESANKALGSSVMASRAFAERSGLDWWRPMGKVVLRGRASAIELYEPAPDFPAADRARLAEALARLETCAEDSIATVRNLTDAYPTDMALANLLKRLEEWSDGHERDVG